MEGISILNYFGESFGWDIIVHGIIFSLSLILGFSILIGTFKMLWARNEIPKYSHPIHFFMWFRDLVTLKIYLSEKPKSTPRRIDQIIHFINSITPKTSSVVFIILLVAALYNTGAVIGPISDKWMDCKWSHRLFFIKKLTSPIDDVHATASYVMDGNNLICTNFLLPEYLQRDAFKEDAIKPFLESHKVKDGITEKELACRSIADCYDSIKSRIDGIDYDYWVKIKTFNELFPDIRYLVHHQFKSDVYYAAKHLILQEKDLREYLNYSQRLINTLQVTVASLEFLGMFCMVSLIILVAYLAVCTVLFIAHLLIPDRLSKLVSVPHRKLVFDKLRIGLVSIMVLVISYIISWASYDSWIKNEKEICYKTYGVLKVMDPCKLNTRQLMVLRCYLFDDSAYTSCTNKSESGT